VPCGHYLPLGTPCAAALQIGRTCVRPNSWCNAFQTHISTVSPGAASVTAASIVAYCCPCPTVRIAIPLPPKSAAGDTTVENGPSGPSGKGGLFDRAFPALGNSQTRLRRTKARPIRPVPNKAREIGSGAGVPPGWPPTNPVKPPLLAVVPTCAAADNESALRASTEN
jgi:hypothetical protein